MSRILIVDDERSMVDFIRIMLKKVGHDVGGATTTTEALAALQLGDFDLVVSDLRIKQDSGIDLLRRVKEQSPTTEFIMMTAYATTENAVEAMKLGAYDYVTKPFNVDEFKELVSKALEKKSLRDENLQLQAKLGLREAYHEIVGKSRAMQQVFDLVDRIKDTPSNVLITGESGTGKEVIARALHEHSVRKNKPFVAVNCGALPENLIESELFGYRKGAFTGATSDREGLFEAANGGTLFLDEIGELPLSMQVKLLRVLQERKVRRVGDTNDRVIDVRLVAATNRDLNKAVETGEFREDLYFRLNVLHLALPPLRERPEDIPLLAHHFLQKNNADMGRSLPGFSDEALRYLQQYRFPGNVRELANIVERAVALTPEGEIQADVLPDHVAGRQLAMAGGLPQLDEAGMDLEAFVEAIEKHYLLRALELSGGSKTKAAELLGMSFRQFRYKVDKFGLK